jgi:hypothetical protein
VIFGLLLSIRWVRTQARRWRLASLNRNKPKHADQAVAASVRIARPILLLVALFSILLCTGVLAEKRGVSKANEFVSKAKKYAAKDHVVVLSHGRSLRLGPVIDCGEVVCIYWVKDRAVLIRRDRIVSETGDLPQLH